MTHETTEVATQETTGARAADHTSKDGQGPKQLSQQAIRQHARRAARAGVERRRQERAATERRLAGLAEEVMVALGERDRAVSEAEARAGGAIRRWVEDESMGLAEMVEWCDGALTQRDAVRLRRVADHPMPASSGDPAAGRGSGGAGGGSAFG